MTVGCVFLSSSVIGEWLEFGVLRRDATYFEHGYGSVDLPLEGNAKVLATKDSGSFENLELSWGMVLGPAGSPSFYPYLKAGIGAYREVIPPPVLVSARLLTNAVELPFIYPTEMRWDAGASLGFGARFGKAGTLSPTVEVRLHFTRLDSQDIHKLLAVTGGLWFR